MRLSRSKVGDHINYRKKRSLALASILQSLAAAEISDTLHLRDFQGVRFFEFFNTIRQNWTSRTTKTCENRFSPCYCYSLLPDSPSFDNTRAAPPMPRRKASSNVTPRSCHRCGRPGRSICHCVAHPRSRSFQTRRPTKATSPPCLAASETSVEDGVLLSSLPLTLDFASAAVCSIMFARRLATQVTRERHKPLLSSRT